MERKTVVTYWTPKQAKSVGDYFIYKLVDNTRMVPVGKHQHFDRKGNLIKEVEHEVVDHLHLCTTPGKKASMKFETEFHENGEVKFTGQWQGNNPGRAISILTPIGTHRHYDESGVIRMEQAFIRDTGGYESILEYDENGAVLG